jgi:hypothetical protein
MASHRLNDREAALQRKLQSYGDFLSATLLLKEALDREDLAEVDRLIKRREELIGMIDGLDRRIDLHPPAVSSHPDAAKGGQATTVPVEIPAEMGILLRRILPVDRECAALAAEKCEAIKQTLMTTHHTKEGLQGYAPKTERTVQFLNMKL